MRPIKHLFAFSVSAILAFAPNLTTAKTHDSIYSHQAIAQPIWGKQGMVVSQEAIASQVGANILKQGGNAVDAAVAVGFALAVTLPRAGNIGGGGFMLVHLSEQNKNIAIDYREMAPAQAHRDMFLDKAGNADNTLSRSHGLAVGVPGTVKGFELALKEYGTMPLASVIAPAIALAKNGIVVTPDLANSLAISVTDYLNGPPANKYSIKIKASNFIKRGKY